MKTKTAMFCSDKDNFMIHKSSGHGHPLRGSRVLITGAGSGIGRLMALKAARRGAREVILWDLSADRAHEVRVEIEAAGGAASVGTVDVSDSHAVAAAAETTGSIDVLINNAGIVTGENLLDTTEEDIRRTYEVNVLALYWTTRAFLPAMVARDSGVIVTVASAAGLVGVAKQTDYSASKFAAVGFTESLRSELRAAGSGVSTRLINPYYIDTGMFAGVTTKFPRLLPILKETAVADRILEAVESGKQQLILPPLIRMLPGLRVLPVRAFDRIMDTLGVNRTMDAFTGRKSQFLQE